MYMMLVVKLSEDNEEEVLSTIQKAIDFAYKENENFDYSKRPIIKITGSDVYMIDIGSIKGKWDENL